MVTSLTLDEAAEYTSRQLNYFFPDKNTVDLSKYKDCVKLAHDRLEFCYKHVLLKHYYNGEQAVFNHLHSDQYLMYLWYLGNSIWKLKQDRELGNKIYYLNKALHGFDCMVDTNLPDIFLIFHGVGTMLGKATYGNYLVVLQGCTVGMNRGKYPEIGNAVSLTAHSSLIGNCKVEDFVTLSSYTNIIDTAIPDHTTVFRQQSGSIEMKRSEKSYAATFFNINL